MRQWMACLCMVVLLASATIASEKMEKDPKKAKNIYGFTVKDIKGKELELKKYKSKVLLIVNTASKCGYTKQYAPLMDLYEKYKEKGLVVIGAPANQFGGQEPGSDKQILEFCQSNYNVKFPLLSKSVVKGEEITPLFQYLTHAKNPDFYGEKEGQIKWNFEKFLINHKGELIRRFRSKVEPLSKEIVSAVEKALKDIPKEKEE